jgi:hypothetical protein
MQEQKWFSEKSKKGEQLYRLRSDLCPDDIGIIIVARGKRYAIAATWNRQRFYLVNDEDKLRTYSRIENAKTLAEQLAPTAAQVREPKKAKGN